MKTICYNAGEIFTIGFDVQLSTNLQKRFQADRLILFRDI